MNHWKQTGLYVLMPLMLGVLAGCGGGGGSSSDPPSPQDINTLPTIIMVAPTDSTVTLDVTNSTTLPIKFKADHKSGDPMNYSVTWDAGNVTPAEGTLNCLDECNVVFTAPGYNGVCTVNIAVSHGDKSTVKTLKINVTGNSSPASQLKILGISMDPATVSPGEEATLTANVDNPEGKTLTYKWSSQYGKLISSGNTATWVSKSTAGVYGIYLTVSDGTSSVKAGYAATVADPEGGLLGEYYTAHWTNNGTTVEFNQKIFERIDGNINFNWYKLSPDSRLRDDKFAVRWTGYVKAEDAGDYVFRTWVDDGVRLMVMNDAGEWISAIPNSSQNWANHTDGEWLPATAVTVHLNGGKWYPIQLEYYEDTGDAFIVLAWSINGDKEVVVPQSALKPTAN